MTASTDSSPGARRSLDNIPLPDRAFMRGMFTHYRRLLHFVQPYWRLLAAAGVMLIFNSLASLALPLVVSKVVDGALLQASLRMLDRVIGLLMALFVLQAVLGFGESYLLGWVGERVVANLRKTLYAHLQNMPLRFFAGTRTGELLSRLGNDVSTIQNAVTDTLLSLLSNAIMLAGGVIIIFVMAWRLTLVMLAVVPLAVIGMIVLGRWVRRYSRQVQDALADISATAEEALAGVRIVKSFRASPTKSDGTAMAWSACSASRSTRAAGRHPGPGHQSAGVQQHRAGAVGGQPRGDRRTHDAGATGLVLAVHDDDRRAHRELHQPVCAAPACAGRQRAGVPVAGRSAGDTGCAGCERPAAHPRRGSLRRGMLRLRRHSQTRIVLSDIDLAARRGQVVALVGASGAGKTTLVNLIPRFYDPNRGRILIDGHDIRQVRLRGLREQIGIVPQETALFSGNVRDNIAYGKLDATQAEIEDAARAANAHDFISDLADGYDTLVGERGVKLSGGQRQRVAIARALLKNPRILILDEATSSLDSESEQAVQEALERLMRDRTTFVIAHRLSTIVNADWIVVLDAGRIAEQGTHADLLARPDGLYHKMVALQFRWDG